MTHPRTSPVITMTGVRKVYRHRRTPHEPTLQFALDDWRVSDAEQWAVFGPSGTGKSTLLELLAGLTRPDQGEILLAGQSITSSATGLLDHWRGRTIGWLPGDPALIESLNVTDNLRIALHFGRGEARSQWLARLREMLDRVGLGHRRRAFPAQLTAGERQRVAIARALINHPAVILADEPTAHLDPTTRQVIVRMLKQLCQEGRQTLIVATHDSAVAAAFEHQLLAEPLMRRNDGDP